MTFAQEVKKECTLLEVHREHARAELGALIRMNGALHLHDKRFVLNVQSENAAIARRIYSLLKENYDVEPELVVRRKMKLKKNNVYIVRVKYGSEKILNDLDILDGFTLNTRVSKQVKEEEQRMRSYLRGAFLAGGSVNDPGVSAGYHLEIYSIYEDHNRDICDMMNHFDLNARVIARRNGYITYIKEAEKISDFLALIGANVAMLEFEDVRIVRDMRNSVNRLVNCENANITKTVTASQKQIAAIKKIDEEQGLDSLSPKLQEIAYLRMENPDLSLQDLGDLVPSGPISKSGVNHRLRRLVKIAEDL